MPRRGSARPGSEALWPYLSLGWRLAGDARWQWLEGDPRLIGVYDLAGAGPLPALAQRLRALHLSTHQPLEQSLRGGTQTDGPLFARADPEIRRLRAAIAGAVERHVAQLPPARFAPPPIAPAARRAGAFRGLLVGAAGGGRASRRSRPSGRVVQLGLLCRASRERRGATARPAGSRSGEARALGIDLPPIRTVAPRPGRLVLFPSTMWHGTRKFPAGERLTVAFDVARPMQ
ncbi:MAG: putative 2OG-Fe(II) oxygenase [Sphingomonas sp.]